ncbi:MAG: elongation factor P [Candidatus Schekmanbacteria bacterium]|nr:elongation factor P [Candidatus Schekmanbacteria bacterium]
MISTAEFRRGLKIEIDGVPYRIEDFQHVKPGKGGAFVRTRLKSLKTGQVIERTYRSGEKVDSPNLEQREVEYLYRDGDLFHMMDSGTYEQFALNANEVGDAKDLMKENTRLSILFHDGVAISVELPNQVVLAVVGTEPGVRGDTASGGSKPAVLETGATVQVPLFINEGDLIKVDTRSREYLERG